MALTVCPNCEQWQRPPLGDCTNECAKRGFAPYGKYEPLGFGKSASETFIRAVPSGYGRKDD